MYRKNVPRKPDPNVRSTLIEVAARLLAEDGPQALSTRRVAADADTSTMAVYTHFGSMSGLVREIVYEGFARLQDYFSQIKETDDPVSDLCVHGRAYRRNALANPHLYAVMFGGESLSGFELSEEDRQHGRYVLASIVGCVGRCVEQGRFRQADPGMVAHHMWFAMHGLVNLELGDYLIEPWGAQECFESQLVTLVVGAGDGLDLATRSVAESAQRLDAELGIRA
ncbi:TetR family transcriptional regulator [Actinophytocola xinjiangensis]|uniref:TetR family transcriptional regulator n=1 Tax=Actinophytocola xinjiangensis TaxID=485602 RepID=A0A7Z1B069_9PSEU|nr:TetR family transcriptional regulator [Actinophytocola xinjiangensis]